jgi:hypothetical protein
VKLPLRIAAADVALQLAESCRSRRQRRCRASGPTQISSMTLKLGGLCISTISSRLEKKRPGQWGVMVWPGRPGDENKRLSLEWRQLTPATIGPTPALPFSIHSANRGVGPVRLFRA